jgi:hypothetical protein
MHMGVTTQILRPGMQHQHEGQSPAQMAREMGEAELERLLTALAVERNVSAASQTLAPSALLLLYQEVLGIELPLLDDITRAKRPARGPHYAACNKNSTFTASNGKTMRPSSVRSSIPASSSAVTSPCTAFTSRPARRAASRMDIGPAPHRTLSSSHRFSVRTFQSSSGVAKLMRAVA